MVSLVSFLKNQLHRYCIWCLHLYGWIKRLCIYSNSISGQTFGEKTSIQRRKKNTNIQKKEVASRYYILIQRREKLLTSNPTPEKKSSIQNKNTSIQK